MYDNEHYGEASKKKKRSIVLLPQIKHTNLLFQPTAL